jgi:hypothetical protein
MTPFPAFPHGGRSKSNFSPLGEIRKGVVKEREVIWFKNKYYEYQ